MADETTASGKEPHYAVLNDETEHRRLFGWWKSLEDNRGERAELRRCATPEEVLPAKAFHRLCRILPQWEQQDLLALAVVAGVLAHVENAGGGSFARQLGTPREDGDKALFSELRFQQLLAAHDHGEFFQRLRRAVQQADRKADIHCLADGILHWARDRADATAAQPSQRFRYTWARDYFQPTLKLAQGE
ncbi:type I-E CRISPR-associated protein Cse2/CasB [Methylococcus sp. ANG]|uniref:type I-E CRISPR-associated protein Cse2/CasB n=1 Tax=Methylococcus sp. ANG TaxID=3231903 RepID=UPI0034584423